MAKNATFFRKLFRDICRGYSEIQFQGSPIYIKHFNTHDQVFLDDIYDETYEQAKIKGLPTEEEKITFLIKQGSWSEKKEKEITYTQDYINRLQQSKKSIILKSKIDKQNEQIKKAQEELSEKLNEKRGLLGLTCEQRAENTLNDYYIYYSLFSDKSLDKYQFESPEEFFELEQEYVELVREYNDYISNFSETNIQSVILEDFYYSYFPFCDDTVGFFGKPVANLSHHQLKLIVYTRVFKNILETADNIPDKIKKDPQALLEFGSMTPEAKERIQKQIEGKGAASLVGAKKEDYEYLGLTPPSDSGNTLNKNLKEYGGNMNMMDMMKAQGIKTK